MSINLKASARAGLYKNLAEDKIVELEKQRLQNELAAINRQKSDEENIVDGIRVVLGAIAIIIIAWVGFHYTAGTIKTMTSLKCGYVQIDKNWVPRDSIVVKNFVEMYKIQRITNCSYVYFPDSTLVPSGYLDNLGKLYEKKK